MKTLNLISIALLMILFSCNSEVKTTAKKVNFGIYEIVQTSEIPDYIIDTLKARNIQLENNTQSDITGYILKSDFSILQLAPNSDIRLVTTFYPVDKDKKYHAIAAIKSAPVINNDDIKNTKAKGNNVNIYFNMQGAKKWKNLSENNIGKSVAFIIDNQIYTMPKIAGEIKNGVAMITGVENETKAKEISESLNASVTN